MSHFFIIYIKLSFLIILMHTHENEDLYIPIFIFVIATFALVYVINKVELSTKDDTEKFINNYKNKIF